MALDQAVDQRVLVMVAVVDTEEQVELQTGIMQPAVLPTVHSLHLPISEAAVAEVAVADLATPEQLGEGLFESQLPER
jgi:hypothetical protein